MQGNDEIEKCFFVQVNLNSDGKKRVYCIMKNEELRFDRNCHVLYSRECEKEIRRKIALHYPEDVREEI